MKSHDLVVPDRVADRVLSKVAMGMKTPYVDTPCHLSAYSTTSHGYAQVRWSDDGVSNGSTCHVVAWTVVNGPVPAGMTVDHRCHVRRCIRIDHLRLLTNEDNGRRNRPGLDWPLDQSCVLGHPAEFRVEVQGSDGRRQTRCELCNRASKAKYNVKPEVKARKIEWQRARRARTPA